jgi:CHAD domain-containing protein
MPDSEALPHVATERVSRLLQKFSLEVRKTLRSRRDPDVIHDFRVSIRRLVQAVDIFEPWFVPAQLRPIRQQLKTFAATAGEIRDADIGLEILAKSGAHNVARWNDQLQERRKTSERRLLPALRRWVSG